MSSKIRSTGITTGRLSAAIVVLIIPAVTLFYHNGKEMNALILVLALLAAAAGIALILKTRP